MTWVCINSRHPNIGRPLVGTINAGDSAVVPKVGFPPRSEDEASVSELSLLKESFFGF